MAHSSKAKFFNYLREGRIKQLEKRFQPPRYGWRQSSDPGYYSGVQNHVAVGAAFQMPLDLALDRRGEPPL